MNCGYKKGTSFAHESGEYVMRKKISSTNVPTSDQNDFQSLGQSKFLSFDRLLNVSMEFLIKLLN